MEETLENAPPSVRAAMFGKDAQLKSDDEVTFEEEFEEEREVKTAAPVIRVTDAVRRKHEAGGHVPYRPWCEDCVNELGI